MTLALLAAMGLYGLTATASDVKSTGHFRQATQAQHAADFAIAATAETFTPATTAQLIAIMMDPTKRSTSACKSAAALGTTADLNAASACLILSEQEISCLSGNKTTTCNANQTTGAAAFKIINPMLQPKNPRSPACGLDCPFFSNDALGGVVGNAGTALMPYVRIELTNPVDVAPPPGSGLDGSFAYTQLTTTVYVDLKTATGVPSDSVVVARGRITAGPYPRR